MILRTGLAAETPVWIEPNAFSASATMVTFEGVQSIHQREITTPEGVYIHMADNSPNLIVAFRSQQGRTGPSEPTAIANLYALTPAGHAPFQNVAGRIPVPPP